MSPKTMRRSIALVFALVAAASSLVFVGALIGWVRTFDVEDRIIWERTQGDSWIASSSRGRIILGRSLYPGIDGSPRLVPIGLHHYSAPVWIAYSTSFPLDPFRTRALNDGAPSPPSPRRQLYYSPNGYYFGDPFRRTYDDHAAFRTYFDCAGFAYQEGMLRSLDSHGRTLSTVVTSWFVLVPCWAVVLASAASPGLWLGRRLLRRYKSRPGSGFDMAPTKPPAPR
jgi:hypothetical protein